MIDESREAHTVPVDAGYLIEAEGVYRRSPQRQWKRFVALQAAIFLSFLALIVVFAEEPKPLVSTMLAIQLLNIGGYWRLWQNHRRRRWPLLELADNEVRAHSFAALNPVSITQFPHLQTEGPQADRSYRSTDRREGFGKEEKTLRPQWSEEDNAAAEKWFASLVERGVLKSMDVYVV